MPMLKTLTIDELIEKLTEVKKEYGGTTDAMICNPCEDGFGFEMLPISDAHGCGGICHVQVPVDKEVR